MNIQNLLKTSHEMASKLDVSPTILRRWCDEFNEFLSSEAQTSIKTENPHYTEGDYLKLLSVKEFLNNGSTYNQVREWLYEEQQNQPPSATPSTPQPLMSAEDVSRATMGLFSETINELRQGQMSVLNSQSANRELMGVVIQDNFNAKEENVRLRNRILELERQLEYSRQEEATQRESLRREFEAKLMEVRQIAVNNPITVLQTRVGCLGKIFGMNDNTQQVIGQVQPYQQQPTRSYPKPPGPPE
ncbi:MAG: hypothetical protein B6242_02980 [Anaerolineaceae bacterium 4572_78]|nr:MAG: hypothetical protein B6242_02980 [Anaerolineaceae bacterium 4572_78]